MSRFRLLCQGKVLYTPPVPLTCEYRHYNNPVLLLKPAKVEMLTVGHENLRMLRDFATPAECQALREAATARLERSVAFTGNTFSPTNFRISTVAWMTEEVEMVKRINTRIRQWTNLNLDTAELLQVSNYGIGGHYEPHVDFHGESRKSADGDRLATFMLYLSEVAAGGATAFPRLGARSFPKMGDAAFWINLLGDDAQGNGDTLHGACPVLSGSKWVANKWIHEQGNEGFHEVHSAELDAWLAERGVE